MVTFGRVKHLEARISALADKIHPSSGIRYVELIWLQPDGNVPDGEGNPVALRPHTLDTMGKRAIAIER